MNFSGVETGATHQRAVYVGAATSESVLSAFTEPPYWMRI